MVYQNTDKVAGINYVRDISARFAGLTKWLMSSHEELRLLLFCLSFHKTDVFDKPQQQWAQDNSLLSPFIAMLFGPFVMGV